MAKAKKNADAEVAAGATANTPENTGELSQNTAPEAATGAALVSIDVLLLQDRQVGDVQRKRGEKLATVLLEPGVTLGYLARAVHDDLAGTQLPE